MLHPSILSDQRLPTSWPLIFTWAVVLQISSVAHLSAGKSVGPALCRAAFLWLSVRTKGTFPFRRALLSCPSSFPLRPLLPLPTPLLFSYALNPRPPPPQYGPLLSNRLGMMQDAVSISVLRFQSMAITHLPTLWSSNKMPLSSYGNKVLNKKIHHQNNTPKSPWREDPAPKPYKARENSKYERSEQSWGMASYVFSASHFDTNKN